MHIFEVEFTLREGLENERFPRSPLRPYVLRPTGADCAEESIEDLLRAWYYNGQVIGASPPLARTGGGYRVFVRTPAEDSLFEPHHSDHARSYRGDWAPDRWGTIQVRRIGRVPDYEPMECPGHPGAELILFTWCVAPEPPVRCAECFGTVPLYALPPGEQGDQGDILGWEDDYRAFDMLGIGDDYVGTFAHREMENPESALSRFGLEVCARIREASGRRMWYHLERVVGTDPESERERQCPRCGGDWLLPECWHDRFDFRCERCGLLSNLARRCESWNDDDGAADADGGAGA